MSAGITCGKLRLAGRILFCQLPDFVGQVDQSRLTLERVLLVQRQLRLYLGRKIDAQRCTMINAAATPAFHLFVEQS